MKCPSCNTKAISFIQWCQGLNAFKTECTNCNIKLNANIATYAIFIVTMLISLSLIPFLNEIFAFIDVEILYKKFQVLILLPIIFVGGIAAWFSGGYSINKKS